MPDLAAWMTALIEFFGGLAVLAGAFIPIVSIPLAVIMLTAMFTVHLPFGFSSIKLKGITNSGPIFGTPGYEINLLYLAALLTLVLGGAGPFSVARLLARRRDAVWLMTFESALRLLPAGVKNGNDHLALPKSGCSDAALSA